MISNLNPDLSTLQYFFEYTDIDETSLKEINSLPLFKKYQDHFPSKWCINIKKQIAFTEMRYVPSGIVRGNNDECYYEFLFFLRNAYGAIEVYCSEYRKDILSYKLKYFGKRQEPILTNEVIIALLHEAIVAKRKASYISYRIDELLRKAEDLKRVYTTIVHGQFSAKLQELLDSVTEICDIDIKLRKICLDHFTEINLKRPRRVDGFYLYDDDDSFAIFDIIVWIYLHKYNSLKQLISDWPEISNYERDYLSSNTIFFLGGHKKFFCEKYINNRVNRGIIIVDNDIIKFIDGYSKTIIEKLNGIS